MQGSVCAEIQSAVTLRITSNQEHGKTEAATAGYDSRISRATRTVHGTGSRPLRPRIGLRDTEVQDYIANVLSEFCEVEQLYKVCTAEGRPLSDVGEMLLETDPIYGPAPSFDRERQVRKHIGDYILFFSGMFPRASIIFACAGSGWRTSSTS